MAAIVIGTVVALYGAIGSVEATITAPEPMRSFFVQIEMPQPLDVIVEAPEGWATGTNYEDGTLRVAAVSMDGQGITSANVRVYLRAESSAPVRVITHDIRGLENAQLEATVENGAIQVLPWGDMDCDGKVTILDATAIMRYLVGKQESLGCGPA